LRLTEEEQYREARNRVRHSTEFTVVSFTVKS